MKLPLYLLALAACLATYPVEAGTANVHLHYHDDARSPRAVQPLSSISALSVYWEDCGGPTADAKVTSIVPDTIPLGTTTVFSGSGDLTVKDITSGTFRMTMTGVGGVTLLDCHGDASARKECTIGVGPVKVGTAAFGGITPPVKKGHVDLPKIVSVQLPQGIPSFALSTVTQLVVNDQDGVEAYCVKISTAPKADRDLEDGWIDAVDDDIIATGSLQATSVDEPSRPTRGCTIADTAAGLHVAACNGIKYHYSVPQSCVRSANNNQSSCGLILDMHGWTMNADIEDENTDMRALGQEYGFVVVQPTAPRRPLPSWVPADSPGLWEFVKAARDEATWTIDPARVHVMGFSQGSSMTWNLLARHSEDIASAVPLSCHAEGSDAATVAKVAQQVPILYSHGYHDGLCPFPQGNATINTIKSTWGMDQGDIVSQDSHHIRTRYKGNQSAGDTFLGLRYRAKYLRTDLSAHRARTLLPWWRRHKVHRLGRRAY